MKKLNRRKGLMVFMRDSFQKFKPYIFETLFYFGVFIFSVICYIIFTPIFGGNEFVGRGEFAKALSVFLLVALGLLTFLLYKNKKLTSEVLIFIIILASFVIRLGYVLYTEGVARQYDTWGDVGHFGYAKTLFETGKMPTTNDYQFYHPPLNALIQSQFMKIFEDIFSFVNSHMRWLTFNKGLELSPESYYSACQTLSVTYITMITVICAKIIRRLKIGGRGGVIANCFIALFPRLVQFSGQLNNDVICLLFSILSLYLSIKFCQNQSWVNIIFLAVSIGLAMMSKLNGALICLPIALLFVILFINRIKTKNTNQIFDLVGKYIVFLFICAPIGLWFQVYAKIRFDQNLGYVFPYLNQNLSTAHTNMLQRFFLPSPSVIFQKPFANAWEDYNLIDYMIKSSMFGEFSYWNGTAFACISVIINYLFQIFFVISLFFWFFHRYFEKKQIFDLSTISMLSVLVTFIVAQFYFYIKMPYGCTMDFRYVVTLIVPYGAMTGIMVNDAKTTRLVGFKSITDILSFFSAALVICASIFYLVCI